MGEARNRVESLEKKYMMLGRQFAELMRNVDDIEKGGRGNRFCIGNLSGFLFLITRDSEFMAQVDGLATATIGPEGQRGKESLSREGTFGPLPPDTAIIPGQPE